MTETIESINLLHKLTCVDGGNNISAKHGLPEKIELSLGLSLNGRFGFEPKKLVADDNDNNKLSRASSVIDFDFPVDLELSLNSTISRAYSLPTPESAAEWRKRKEVQSLRRSEAKRKRVEKLKNVKVVKEYQPKISPSPAPSPSLAPVTPVRFSSQGSVGSLGSGGSSGVSDLDSQPFSELNRDTTECNEINKAQCNPKIKPSVHCAIDQTMPCVSTKEDGPDGKRVQGFLYSYGKGEEVRIVCVCHGSFLTPAEFVKHGGGGDVENPLRHIVVTKSLFS